MKFMSISFILMALTFSCTSEKTNVAVKGFAGQPSRSIASPKSHSLICLMSHFRKFKNSYIGKLRMNEASSLIGHIKHDRVDEVREKFQQIITHSFKSDKKNLRAMRGSDFNRAKDQLFNIAKEYGIEIENTLDTIGVFPEGLRQVKLSGFGSNLPDDAKVSFIQQHELGHLFHVLFLRVAMIESLDIADEKTLKLIASTLKSFETNGRNYREFEKAVTGMASPAHLLSKRSRSLDLYAKRLEDVVHWTGEGLKLDRIHFPNGKTFEEVYAIFISKAPILVGTSIQDLMVRFPPIFFSIAYLLNINVEHYGITVPEGSSGGLRDFVNSLIFSKAKD